MTEHNHMHIAAGTRSCCKRRRTIRQIIFLQVLALSCVAGYPQTNGVVSATGTLPHVEEPKGAFRHWTANGKKLRKSYASRVIWKEGVRYVVLITPTSPLMLPFSVLSDEDVAYLQKHYAGSSQVADTPQPWNTEYFGSVPEQNTHTGESTSTSE